MSGTLVEPARRTEEKETVSVPETAAPMLGARETLLQSREDQPSLQTAGSLPEPGVDG